MKKIISTFVILTLLLSYICATNVSAVSGQEIINEALKWLEAKSPYGPADGSGGYGSTVDCSGLVMQVYKKFGFSLGRTTYVQATAGRYVDKWSLQPGDIVCMSYPDGRIGHVGIYVGDDKMIHAPGTGRYVQYGTNISSWTYSNGGCKLEYGRRLIDDIPGYAPKKPSVSDTSRTLEIEELNEEYNVSVQELQRCLNYLMDAGLSEDGVFGAKTENAVKNFQSAYGLTPDGVAGPQTLKALNNAIGAGTGGGESTTVSYVQGKMLTFKIGDTNMYVDGNAYEIDPGKYATPVIENGRTLLPVRVVAETFGAEVGWDGAENKVTITTDGIEMQFWVDSNKAIVNGIDYTLDAAPVVIDGRTYMPLRFVAEKLGLSVVWDDLSQSIIIER